MENSEKLDIRFLSPLVLDFFSKRGFRLAGSFPLAGSAGSGRKFYRIQAGQASYVLVISPAVDADFHRFVEYSRFFCSLHLPTPEVFLVDESHRQILQSDLGSTHLFDLAQEPARRESLYDQALEALVLWQFRATSEVSKCPALAAWQFDFRGLRWETSYFTENYLIPHTRPSPGIIESLSLEFDRLAERVAGHPRVVMHRDFQSQNIMFREGTIGIVDFQGARMGSVFYDAASLLWDPYILLPVDFIQARFRTFHEASPLQISLEESWNFFLEASLQRLMQACGAYCFLSAKKGIAHFTQYLTPGLHQLQSALEQVQNPELSKLKNLLLQLIGSTSDPEKK